jgi:predicted DNA binding CopG/RHH family protein
MKGKKPAKAASKRRVIPIDFPEGLHSELKAEAEAQGLKLSTYIRSLVVTHPRRKENAVDAEKKKGDRR